MMCFNECACVCVLLLHMWSSWGKNKVLWIELNPPLDTDTLVHLWPYTLESLPPIALLQTVLDRVHVERHVMILIASFLSTKTWFSDLIPLLKGEPWTLPTHRDLLSKTQCGICQQHYAGWQPGPWTGTSTKLWSTSLSGGDDSKHKSPIHQVSYKLKWNESLYGNHVPCSLLVLKRFRNRLFQNVYREINGSALPLHQFPG